MAAKQMEEIQRKLGMLNYPRANAPAHFLLFAGMERYALLEWLFFKLLGDKSPFSQLNLQRDTMDRDEETARIQYLAEIAMFLGITSTLDTEVIQGQGSYEDRTEKLRLIVDHVEASRYANNLEWSVDEQVAKDIQLIDSIAEKQALIFSEECKLFPADVQIQSIYPLPDHAYNPDEEYAEVESDSRHIWNLFWKLQGHSMPYTLRYYELLYPFVEFLCLEIRPWTHMMEVPQLHGFGLAANRLLEAYKMLWKVSQHHFLFFMFIFLKGYMA
ncbi:hypothetical protein POTOM_058138 [Populus tomentosa]|uniref:AUGMIN subunit 7 n=1 Tax=Populus tomentosa TaxID=118781 RepID=A0A8X7XQG2_POPTO|nr:hypothetical protein POTOM_058138 [Populus tomentosa]